MDEETRRCMKIHGLLDSGSSDTENEGKFDDTYEFYKPPPIEIDPSRVVAIRAETVQPSNPKLSFVSQSIEVGSELEPKVFDGAALEGALSSEFELKTVEVQPQEQSDKSTKWEPRKLPKKVKKSKKNKLQKLRKIARKKAALLEALSIIEQEDSDMLSNESPVPLENRRVIKERANNGEAKLKKTEGPSSVEAEEVPVVVTDVILPNIISPNPLWNNEDVALKPQDSPTESEAEVEKTFKTNQLGPLNNFGLETDEKSTLDNFNGLSENATAKRTNPFQNTDLPNQDSMPAADGNFESLNICPTSLKTQIVGDLLNLISDVIRDCEKLDFSTLSSCLIILFIFRTSVLCALKFFEHLLHSNVDFIFLLLCVLVYFCAILIIQC